MRNSTEIDECRFWKKKNIYIYIVATVSDNRINIGDQSILKYFAESIFAIDQAWKPLQKKFRQIRVNIIKANSVNFSSAKIFFL